MMERTVTSFFRSFQRLDGRTTQAEPPQDTASETRTMKVATFVAPLAVLAVAVAAQLPDAVASDMRGPANMSTLHVQGLTGYPVYDASGESIGEVVEVETDAAGRTRYVRLELDDGREARLSAFRARLDEATGRIDLAMPRYAVQMAAGPAPILSASRE